MLTEPGILEALRACYASSGDLQYPINVVDLGLVESIVLTPAPEAPGFGIPGVPSRQHLALTLISPAPDSDAQAQLLAQISNRLAGLPELFRISVQFAPTPSWTPGRISPEVRRRLNLDPSPFQILNRP